MDGFQFLELSTKPGSQICYRLEPSPTAKPHLLVFLNGLGLPQAGWSAAIAKLKELRKEADLPSILTYDRFGQGQTTDRDPQDKLASDPAHAHDCISVVRDLHQLLGQIVNGKLGIAELESVPLILVANSIGCALARLYAQEYPGTVSALLLLDSVLANSDFVSIFPDPDAENFDASVLPAGITPEALRTEREGVRKTFHPDVGSREGLSRKNLATLLPGSDSPVLKGPGGCGPFVTVVGHDFETFVEESAKMGRQKLLTRTYANPYWHTYNEGLAKITEGERAKGPLLAPNSGHFVQKDNPELVAKELDELLSKIMV
ncbi:alpha/beta-hydrolase [Thozetella sp. PMI_491]|nr:alpha/beta-hydrolase [Thozetella sp. PMI_491]